MTEEKKAPIGFLGDNVGDKSSKRLAGFILLVFFLAVSTFGLIFEASVGWESLELVKYIAISSLSGSGLCFGLTLSETLIKK